MTGQRQPQETPDALGPDHCDENYCQPHRPITSLEDDISGEVLEWECIDCGTPCNPWGYEW